jgi:hypothetical protein
MTEPGRPTGRCRPLWMAFVCAALVVAAGSGAPAERLQPRSKEPLSASLPATPLALGPGGGHGPAQGEVSRAPRSGSRSRRKRWPQPPPVRSTGRLTVVAGNGPVSGPGYVRRFLVEVEKGLPIDRASFARAVRAILYDRRGWGAGGRIAFRRVDSPPVAFRVALATPRTTDRLCAPLETLGRYSCHQNGRAVLNFWRWQRGARSYGPDLEGYRTYLVNHEVGHALGHSWHRPCARPGARAPVMMQQTVAVSPCRASPWPGPEERAALP